MANIMTVKDVTSSPVSPPLSKTLSWSLSLISLLDRLNQLSGKIRKIRSSGQWRQGNVTLWLVALGWEVQIWAKTYFSSVSVRFVVCMLRESGTMIATHFVFLLSFRLFKSDLTNLRHLDWFNEKTRTEITTKMAKYHKQYSNVAWIY